MRMQTLNKPVLLLAKLQWQSLITETDLWWYDAAEKFYEDGMISYLKSTWLYDTFLQESIQGSSEYNNYLIKKYFSNTEKLYQTILGE
jgi:hypothetical protein